ncbi:MAG: hypothetical protein ACRDMX_03305 [Solirubrobacteraceae bacterium]
MTTQKRREIDWASAQVHTRTLTVDLTGAGSKAWNTRLLSVLAMLGSSHGGWGEARLNRRALKVVDLTPGKEEELRHFLESAVLQANSGLEAAEPEPDEDSDPEADEDARLTEVFRGFAAE